MNVISMTCLGLLALLSLAPRSSFAGEDIFTLQPGDVIQVTVWKEEGMDREVLVLPDGTINFPLIGTIMVKDVSPYDVQTMIKEKLQTTIPDASVTVSVTQPLGHKVSVLGQVQKPGEFVMTSGMGVLQALSQAGGLTPYADDGDIKIIRKTEKGKQYIEFPYDDISRGRNLDKDVYLKPGDVVMVPTSGLF